MVMHDGACDMSKSKDVLHDLAALATRSTHMLFDLDETLVDTNLANYLAYKQAVKEITHQELNANYREGQRFCRSSLNGSIPFLSESDRENIIALKGKYYENYLPTTKLNFVLANILRIYSATIDTVLVTNCEEVRAIQTLRYHGIQEYFRHFFFHVNAPDNFKKNKYDTAIARLGLDPKSILAFENEAIDINCAIQSGIPRGNILSLRVDGEE